VQSWWLILAAAPLLLGVEPPPVFTRDAEGVGVTGIPVPRAGWETLLRVSVGSRENPPLLGNVEKTTTGLRFRPRFPVAEELDLVVVLAGKQEYRLRGTRSVVLPTTRVAAIYPSAKSVPANLLKFYLHFDAPMARGEAWRHLRLLDERGEAVDLPFLEIDQELWDPEMKRLTLLFDPGRIKRGVLPREQGGTALEEGKRYTLLVDAGWKDSQGRPLAAGFRHEFRAGPEERRGLSVSQWSATVSGSELRIRFDRPLDRALALRLITVDAEGEAHLEDEQQTWVFVAKEARPEYRVTVDHRLEDLAGNRPGRPFDVDVFDRITKVPVAETTVLTLRAR
jgi:hypothetical protein